MLGWSIQDPQKYIQICIQAKKVTNKRYNFFLILDKDYKTE